MTNDDKENFVGLNLVSVKDVQVGLQKTITWTKKSSKGRHEWDKACIEIGMQH
jgi:hypothetical protein